MKHNENDQQHISIMQYNINTCIANTTPVTPPKVNKKIKQ
jgi:hypothetical protein